MTAPRTLAPRTLQALRTLAPRSLAPRALAPRTLADRTLAVRALPARVATRLHADDPEAGMSTAEYAVGTVAACGFGGVLYKVVTSSQVLELLRGVIAKALKVSF